VTKERIAEIAANFMTVFYRIQVGALKTQELLSTPVQYWLVVFSDTVKGPIHQLFFTVPANRFRPVESEGGSLLL
jgi:hypothetical protein